MNKRVFIQIPLLITILLGALVLSGAGYFGYRQMTASNTDSQTQQNTTDQASQIEELQKEVEELKKVRTGDSEANTSPQVATPKTTTKSNNPPPKSKQTFTLPNGAVIDDAGNIISPPTITVGLTQADSPNVVAGSKVLSGEEIYLLVSPSVVFISTPEGTGSGFVISGGKYTLTNAHVVGAYESVMLKFQNGVSVAGTVFGKDEARDLAVVFNSYRTPPAVTFGTSDSGSLKIGADVYALGYPLNLPTITFTKGQLSARQNLKDYPGVILQTDTAINSGNSGGPLVNNKGEVIGVNFARLKDVSAQGIGFAIPIQTAIDLIPALSQYGKNRLEVYPIGSTMHISVVSALQIDYNPSLSCEKLGANESEVILCDLYRNHHDDYKWIIDVQN